MKNKKKNPKPLNQIYPSLHEYRKRVKKWRELNKEEKDQYKSY